MALYKAGITAELREVDLKNKPLSLLETSPKGTVPVIILPDKTVIDQSLDIMKWALEKSDPDAWLNVDSSVSEFLIKRNDTSFKAALDRYKYPNHSIKQDYVDAKDHCLGILMDLDKRLKQSKYLAGDTLSLVDIALFPFIRQCAFVDKNWFYGLPLAKLQNLLDEQLTSSLFKEVMIKHDIWQPDSVVT